MAPERLLRNLQLAKSGAAKGNRPHLARYAKPRADWPRAGTDAEQTPHRVRRGTGQKQPRTCYIALCSAMQPVLGWYAHFSFV